MSLRKSPTLKSSKVRVGLTIGDPAGIGPAITLKAIQQLEKSVSLTVIGNRFILKKASRILRIDPDINLVDLDNINTRHFAFGKVNAECGQASIDYLDAALNLLKNKEIDCLVTCPISKEAINLAGVRFSGHTEYLGSRLSRTHLVMMLLNHKLKFSLVTRHIPLKQVCARLNKEELESNILNTIKGLRSLFAIPRPRLVLCGVNPHASDNGLIGEEENKLLRPVMRGLKNRAKAAFIEGPLPADVAIAAAAKGKFDCVIALYHDQALIPLKLTGPDTGVNLTLGLPFIRTSPLHGTAFDIAARPKKANPDSLIAAIKLAVKCALNQKKA